MTEEQQTAADVVLVSPKVRILEWMAKHGVTVESEFVPFSKSRSAEDLERSKHGPNLNWKVRVLKGGREVTKTDYSAGQAHAPSFKQNQTVDVAAAVRFECENGKRAHPKSWGHTQGGKPILPNPCDVLSSLVMDSDVLDCGTFEEWAWNLGWDADSRKAEKIYRQCIAIALQLRNGLGESAMAELREACQDY